jgi:hypothetical protein
MRHVEFYKDKTCIGKGLSHDIIRPPILESLKAMGENDHWLRLAISHIADIRQKRALVVRS